jgi:hypothetical protein
MNWMSFSDGEGPVNMETKIGVQLMAPIEKESATAIVCQSATATHATTIVCHNLKVKLPKDQIYLWIFSI